MPDPVYVAARRTLLDALDALGSQREAVVLCGAQAVYLHVGEADLAVAPYTTDGDIALDPTALAKKPLIERAMVDAGFDLSPTDVGTWRRAALVEGTSTSVGIDLLVPDSVAGPGRRGARIPPHGKNAARKVRGLEGVLVDRRTIVLAALEPGDERAIPVSVAGPSALVVAKVHKLQDRANDLSRLKDKDALDVYRLFRGVSENELVTGFMLLQSDSRSAPVTAEALAAIGHMFGSPRSPGVLMARRAAEPLEDGETLAASLAALTDAFLRAIQSQRP